MFKMKQKKMGFFKRTKNAIINFDEYKTFAEEKIWTTIKYILKIAFVFSLIVSFALTYKVTQEVTKALQIYKNECPEFRFENNTLIIDSDNKQFLKGDPNGYVGILLNSEKRELNEIQEATNYQVIVAVLKDKLIIKDSQGIKNSITYEQISSKFDINTINKQEIVNIVLSDKMIEIYTLIIVVSLIYLCLVYFVQFILDILVLSLVGYLLSKIIGIKFKYKSIFNMSAHAIILSIILYMIYLCVNIITGFTIKYFEIAYNAIAYIYIITAMLMIKSDLIKQQIEVGEIVEEQKKVREEKQKEQEQEKKEEDKKQDKEKEDNDKKEKNKENNEEEGQPEGNQA